MLNISVVEFFVGLVVILIAIPLLISRSKSKKKREEIKAKTIRYFHWDSKRKQLILFSHLGGKLVSLSQKSRYYFDSFSTDNSELCCINFTLNFSLPIVSDTFYIKNIDSVSFEAVAEMVGIINSK